MAVPTFSIAEREPPWNLARTFMQRESLDALLVFGEREDSGPATVPFDTWFTNARAGHHYLPKSRRPRLAGADVNIPLGPSGVVTQRRYNLDRGAEYAHEYHFHFHR